MTKVFFKMLSKHFKVPMALCNDIFTSFFIVFLKSTAGVMKNDVYSFVISHLILKLSHFLYFEL